MSSWTLKMWFNSSAQEIFMNDSLYLHEFWRCDWVMLGKFSSIVANIFVNSRCDWINAVSWVIKKWDFASRHSFLTHLMLVSWASMWLFYDTSEVKTKTKSKSKSKAKAKDEGRRYRINSSKVTIKTMTSQ